MTITIYGLTDPADPLSVRYVGQTQQRHLSNRLSQHCVDARAGRSGRKNEWVREVLAAGRRPTMIVLAVDPPDGDASEREWIDRLPDLLNQTSGGTGAPDPDDDVRARLSAARRREWADGTRDKAQAAEVGRASIDAARAVANEVWRGRKHSDESRAKMAAAQTGKRASEATRAKMAASQAARREREAQARSGAG